MHGADHHVGEPREGFARLPRGQRAGQNADADQEHVLLPEHADAVEEILVVARLRQRRVEPLAQLRVVRQGAEEARIDQRIHHLRMARNDVGEPRRGAEHQSDQRDQLGVLPQQRQQPARRRAAWRGSGRTAPAPRSGCRSAPSCSSSSGSSACKLLPRHLALQRAVVAGEPVPHDPRGFQRALKPSSARRSSVLRSSASGGKVERAAGRRRARFRTAARSGAAPCRDGRPAPRRKRRGRQSRESGRSAPAPRAPPAAPASARHATICSRCSTLRRKQ